MVPLNDAVGRLLDDPNPAVLATTLLISSAAGRCKERNLRRDPRASLIVYDPADPQRYVEIRGRATVTEDVGRAPAVRLAEAYEGPGAGQEYLELPPQVMRIVLWITPEHLTGTLPADATPTPAPVSAAAPTPVTRRHRTPPDAPPALTPPNHPLPDHPLPDRPTSAPGSGPARPPRPAPRSRPDSG